MLYHPAYETYWSTRFDVEWMNEFRTVNLSAAIKKNASVKVTILYC